MHYSDPGSIFLSFKACGWAGGEQDIIFANILAERAAQEPFISDDTVSGKVQHASNEEVPGARILTGVLAPGFLHVTLRTLGIERNEIVIVSKFTFLHDRRPRDYEYNERKLPVKTRVPRK